MDSKIEQRAVIAFYTRDQKPCGYIHTKLLKVYGDFALSLRTVERWALRFQNGDFNLSDLNRSGNPGVKIDNEVILDILKQKPFSSARSIAEELEVSPHTIINILETKLGFRLLHLKWIPHFLTDKQRIIRMEKASELLELLRKKNKMFKYIITGDESWIFYNNPIKQAWTLEGNSFPSNINRTIADQKIMLTVFFNAYGILLIDFKPDKCSFDSKYMVDSILPILSDSIASRRKVKRCQGYYIHFDNARPHMSETTTSKINELGLLVAPHPPYSPDLAPSDFWLFGLLKQKLKGNQFKTRIELEIMVSEMLNSIDKKYFFKAYEAWIERLEAVIARNGDYL